VHGDLLIVEESNPLEFDASISRKKEAPGKSILR
jgi:hypothetical protein